MCSNLQFTFVSRRDAYDVALLVHQHCTKTFPGFSLGQIVLHKGYIEKGRKSKVSNVRRYLRLVSNRLLLYRTHDAPYPVNVIELVWAARALICMRTRSAGIVLCM